MNIQVATRPLGAGILISGTDSQALVGPTKHWCHATYAQFDGAEAIGRVWTVSEKNDLDLPSALESAAEAWIECRHAQLTSDPVALFQGGRIAKHEHDPNAGNHPQWLFELALAYPGLVDLLVLKNFEIVGEHERSLLSELAQIAIRRAKQVRGAGLQDEQAAIA